MLELPYSYYNAIPCIQQPEEKLNKYRHGRYKKKKTQIEFIEMKT